MDDEGASRFLQVILEKEGYKSKAGDLAAQFSTLKAFKNTDFVNTRIMRGGDKTEIKLTEKEIDRIERAKKHIHPQATVNENWIRFTVNRAIYKMLEKIKNTKLDDMNMNPFLTKMLRLKEPREMITFNIYQHITRSLVTSMGTALERMVASDSRTRLGRGDEWYDVIKEDDDATYWIQVKSGPNNIDKDQMKYFNDKFNKTEEKKNNFARLGITYGKRELNTISLGFAKKYLDNGDDRILVGRELWEFVSGKSDYHSDVLKWIDSEIEGILHDKSIEIEIHELIERVINEFTKMYGKGENSVKKYIKESI